jgi:nitrogen fixation negative regulator NifL
MDKNALPSLKHYLGKDITPDELVVKLETMAKNINSNQSLPVHVFIEAVEQAPIAISITDKKANILYVNAEFSKVTGYQAAEVINKNESILSDKSTPRNVYYNLWRTISHKKIWQGQLINRHKLGKRYLADLTITPMLNEMGEITHYIGMHKDLTDVYQAEQQIKNQKKLIESVTNLLPIAMVVLNEHDQVVLDNHLYKALVSDLDKKEPALYFLQLLRDEMGQLWQHYQDNLQGFSQREFRVERKNKAPRWFSCSGSWLTEQVVGADTFFSQENTRYLILTLTDITKQRKQLEELHLQSLKLMMAEDEQIRSIRETLLGAMHQIQLPMNQIRAAQQILQLKQDEQHHSLLQILQQIQQSGQEAIATMQNCIPIIMPTSAVPLNLNQVLHEVLLLCNTRLNTYGIEVDWKPMNQLPSVLGSENKLRSLFKQLIDNAIEAMVQQATEPMQLKIATANDGEWIYACVSDTGPGIAADKRAKVFEPFYTTRQDSHQAGMGLVMVKEIIDQHEGFIEIDADYKHGCRFKLSFPHYKNRQETDS